MTYLERKEYFIREILEDDEENLRELPRKHLIKLLLSESKRNLYIFDLPSLRSMYSERFK